MTTGGGSFADSLDMLGIATAYFLSKYIPYVLWSGYGIWLLSPKPGTLARRALVLGVLRLALGLMTGWTLVYLVAVLAPAGNRLGFSIPVYYPLLLLVRWLEWSVISGVIRRSWRRLPLGTGRADTLWRLGGVAVSCLTDVLVIFVIGAMGWIPC